MKMPVEQWELERSPAAHSHFPVASAPPPPPSPCRVSMSLLTFPQMVEASCSLASEVVPGAPRRVCSATGITSSSVGWPNQVPSDVANRHSSTTDPTCSQLVSPAALYSEHHPETFGGPQNRGEVPPGPPLV